MLRIVLAAIAAVSLAGCWTSAERIFGDGDWAALTLDGHYISENASGENQAWVVLKTRANGLVEASATGIEDGETEQSLIGLVRIDRGSGRYFLMVDRSDNASEGDIYLVAHFLEDGALAFYWPDCDGTPAGRGLAIERDAFTRLTVCAFSTRAALMRAGLEAERFLSAKHIVAVAPAGRLVPDTRPEPEN